MSDNLIDCGLSFVFSKAATFMSEIYVDKVLRERLCETLDMKACNKVGKYSLAPRPTTGSGDSLFVWP